MLSMRILRADQFSDRLLTDPQYVQKEITEWIKNWKKNGWKNSTGKPVKNIELRKQLDELCCMCNVTWQWVRGHNDNAGNEQADRTG